MFKEAILHRIDSEYSYPIDKNTLVVRLRVSKKDKFTSVKCLFNPAMKFLKFQKEIEMEVKYEDNDFLYYEAKLQNDFPSFSYIFTLNLENDPKTYYVSDEGIFEEYDYRFSQVSAFRYAFINEDDVIKVNKKFEGRIIYQIFVDSFNIGRKENKGYITRAWDSKDLFAFKNKEYHPVFLGGDLKGITLKLDYLKEIGIGAIYLTPIFEAKTNHKYDTMDYFKIDEMFGDESDLKELVNEAHKKDILICLDLVFNHTSFFNPMFQDVIKNGRKSKYHDFYIIDGDKPTTNPLNYMTFSEAFMMPKLNGNNPLVQEYTLDVAKHYVEKFNVDAYRLDVSNELPHSFWMNFKRELKKIKEDIFLIGECWYNASSFLNAYEWDSSMNYATLFSAKEYFAEKKFSTKEFIYRLNASLMRYREPTNRMLLNLLDSHDVSRFYEFVKPNLNLYLLSELFLISFIGTPMVYYGDEVFMEGGDDPLNRQGMIWNSSNFNKKEHYILKDIYKLRSLEAFKSGEMKLKEENSLLIIERCNNDSFYKVIINNSDKKIPYEFEEDEVVLKNNAKDNLIEEFGFIVTKRGI